MAAVVVVLFVAVSVVPVVDVVVLVEVANVVVVLETVPVGSLVAVAVAEAGAEAAAAAAAAAVVAVVVVVVVLAAFVGGGCGGGGRAIVAVWGTAQTPLGQQRRTPRHHRVCYGRSEGNALHRPLKAQNHTSSSRQQLYSRHSLHSRRL